MVISKYFAAVNGWTICLLNVQSIEDLSLALGIERCIEEQLLEQQF